MISGFCAAHAQLSAGHASWWEYSPRDAPDLRALFGRSGAGAASGFDVQAPPAWWERFIACGIIGALETAGLWRDGALTADPFRVGICFSSSKGHPASREKSAAPGAVASGNADFENSVLADNCDWALREIACMTGARGRRGCPVAACAGGAHAIALGAQWIEDGACDVVICGAIEAELAALVLAGYKSLGALSAQKLMRPFDARRDGFVPAPGAACLLLESEASARNRDAASYGAVTGWSFLCDASSLTGLESSGEAIARAMNKALGRATCNGSTPVVDYVNAHGTATRMNDEIEARAIARALGAQTPVSSTKPLTGHTLGAAGAIEAVLCLLAMQQNFAPPNLNLQSQDARCEIDVLQSGRDVEIATALSLSYGFGGHIGVLRLEKI